MKPIDPYDTPEYHAWVESMAKSCHCAHNKPCDGVLAGGMCDNIQDDPEGWECWDQWSEEQADAMNLP